MRSIEVKRILGVLVFGLTMAGIAWLAWPSPIPVDVAVVSRGAMAVTIDDEAKTRVREIYTVSAPVSGKVLRTSRNTGDQVIADETVVAVMQPMTPAFHDASTHEALLAAVAAAEATEKFAKAEVRRMAAALAFSRRELDRAQALSRTNSIAARMLDQARFDVEINAAALASAKAQLDVRRSERASVAARLIDPSNVAQQSGPADPTCCIRIRSPVSGRVLRVMQESEAVVPVGAPLLEIGDPRDLEVVAELLSTDVVQIKIGSLVRIDGWGGVPVQGRVTRIDPAGFVKMSSLGIEEQRVRTWMDFVDPPELWNQLGHDYRVIVHVAIWQADAVLTVPIGALFRNADDWAVFVMRDGRAHNTIVTTGQRNNRMAEVTSGLVEGDKVILHPSDRISDGVAVAEREVR